MVITFRQPSLKSRHKRGLHGRFFTFNDGPYHLLRVPINDYVANIIQAQLLFLESVDAERIQFV